MLLLWLLKKNALQPNTLKWEISTGLLKKNNNNSLGILKLILECGFELYKKAVHWTAEFQKKRSNLAEVKSALAQLFIVWFNHSARPFFFGGGITRNRVYKSKFYDYSIRQKDEETFLFIYSTPPLIIIFKSFNRNIMYI